MSINIKDYIFQQPLICHNSGFSKWGIGQRDGRDYFVKEFLSPVYPAEPSMFSEENRQDRIELCDAFAEEKKRLYAAVRDVSDGNLIGVEEFFRVGAKFYLSTKAVTAPALSVDEIAGCPLCERVKLCCIVAHGIMRLHSKRIVHADIKPDNVLVTGAEKLHAKIIDFDCSFFEMNAPKPGEELNGDMVYFSPEVYQHIAGENTRLTCAMDVFSLGILFHQYLTGRLPHFDTDRYRYAYEAVMDGQTLGLDAELAAPVSDLLERMLRKDFRRRPDMQSVFGELKQYYASLFQKPKPAAAPAAPEQEEKPEEKKEAYREEPQEAEGLSFFSLAGDLLK